MNVRNCNNIVDIFFNNSLTMRVHLRIILVNLYFQQWCMRSLCQNVPGETSETKTLEVCHAETFEASCEEQHVILMTSAKLGRMSPGRCITGEYGGMECFVNVLEYMDEKCSGRQSCSVKIADPPLHDRSPCNRDLVSYLEAAYRCVKVAWAPASKCNDDLHIAAGDTAGYIASDVTVKSGFVGTDRCPWTITAPEGQRIELTLLNFGLGKMADEVAQESVSLTKSREGCHELASVKYLPPSQNIQHWEQETQILSCPNNNMREKVLHLSKTGRVQVAMVPGRSLNKVWPFLLKYEVRGCKKLLPPPGGEVKINGNTAIVTCTHSKYIWYLTCVQRVWVGEDINCTNDRAQVMDEQEIGYDFPIGILLVVAVGVALGVFLGGILLTLVAMHMRKRQRKRPPVHNDEYYETYHMKGPGQYIDSKSLDPSLYYGLSEDTYNTTLSHHSYLDCPTHGHSDHDHVRQPPDICGEHHQHPDNTKPARMYTAKNSNQLGKDPYVHMNTDLETKIENRSKSLILV